jgi:dynein heavy chain
LNEQIGQIDDVWRKCSFNLGLDEKTEVQILKDMDEIYTNLDETLASINMILGSRFVKPLRDLAERWKRDIMYMDDMVSEWLSCQKNWRYLANIFKAPDIKAAMMEETKMFDGVDKFYRQLMVKTGKTFNVFKIMKQYNPLENLKQNNKTLDYVQKKLEDYMELKRAAFPRFYFLSSDELIDILANSQNLDVIQGHLKTCFDNIVKIDIGDDGVEILGMNSNEKENVQFKKPRNARGQIEKWLNDIQDEMIITLRHLLNTANKEYPT